MNFANKAFTLMELMVVVTIIGIVAAFAIPDYTKSVAKAHRKDGENNLLMIKAAMHLYAARNNGVYPPGGTLTVDTINANLGLNIIPNDMVYQCTSVGGTVFSCAAWQNGHSWILEVDQTQPNVYCIPQPELCP